jgi:hypothetical protein
LNRGIEKRLFLRSAFGQGQLFLELANGGLCFLQLVLQTALNPLLLLPKATQVMNGYSEGSAGGLFDALNVGAINKPVVSVVVFNIGVPE